MFAVVDAGGRQYRVTPGEVVKMDKLHLQKGDAVTFDKIVLLSADGGDLRVGAPYVPGVQVSGTLIAQNRDKKIVVFRYKPKKRVRVKRGHRQSYSLVRIEGIKA